MLLRRELIVWSDLLRFNFKHPDYLALLERYVDTLVTTFHGLRVDNCHSTPAQVLEFIAQRARRTRPNVLILAELFDAPARNHELYSQAGMDCIVREISRADDSASLAGLYNSTVDQHQQVGSYYELTNREKCNAKFFVLEYAFKLYF